MYRFLRRFKPTLAEQIFGKVSVWADGTGRARTNGRRVPHNFLFNSFIFPY
jgi:hypothetical protein